MDANTLVTIVWGNVATHAIWAFTFYCLVRQYLGQPLFPRRHSEPLEQTRERSDRSAPSVPHHPV